MSVKTLSHLAQDRSALDVDPTNLLAGAARNGVRAEVVDGDELVDGEDVDRDVLALAAENVDGDLGTRLGVLKLLAVAARDDLLGTALLLSHGDGRTLTKGGDGLDEGGGGKGQDNGLEGEHLELGWVERGLGKRQGIRY